MQKAVCSFNREQAAFWHSINIWQPAKREREELFMKKMRKSASNVNNAVNLISGAYTLPLIDKLFSDYSGVL